MGNYSGNKDVKNCFDEFKNNDKKSNNTRMVRLIQVSIVEVSTYESKMTIDKEINKELTKLISSNYTKGFKFIDLKVNVNDDPKKMFATIIYEIDSEIEIDN